MNLHIEQKVVCIREFSPDNLCPGEVAPQKDAVYTIRGIDPPRDEFDFYSLKLREIVNPVIDRSPWPAAECSFDVEHFRPAVEREYSIEVFRRMQLPSRQLEKV